MSSYHIDWGVGLLYLLCLIWTLAFWCGLDWLIGLVWP